MTTTTKFCALEDVKPLLYEATGYSGDDTQIEAHIKQATALIRAFTRRDWETGTFVDYFTTGDIDVAVGIGSNTLSFTLREKPLQSIASIKFNTGGEWANTDPLESTEYEIDTRLNRVVMYPQRSVSHARSLRIEYVAGYEVDGSDSELLLVNSNLKQACAIQAAHTWRRVLNETSGTNSKSDKTGSKSFKVSSSGLVAEAQAMLRGQGRLLMGSH